jgi:UDP-glucose 4-epimerase
MGVGRAKTPREQLENRQKGQALRYLVTGGSGFIGSHLCDRLSADGHDVLVLDDLSTGRVGNIAHLLESGRAQFVEGSVLDRDLVHKLLDAVDACLHLASAVGVGLVVDRPVDTLLSNVRGIDTVLSATAALEKPLLLTSTSEIYGKSDGRTQSEDSNRILALGYHRELGAKNVVVRLFNTVGPRQTGAYGMVLPRLVRQALTGEPVTVYGDGRQTRCFTHVHDTVDAVVRLLASEAAAGQVFNVGSDGELSIHELAQRVIARAESPSEIRLIPYGEAYADGFEELGRRKPDTAALRALTGWEPERTVDDAIDDVILYERAALDPEAGRRIGLAR